MKKKLFAGLLAIILVIAGVIFWTHDLNYQNVGENSESHKAYEEWVKDQDNKENNQANTENENETGNDSELSSDLDTAGGSQSDVAGYYGRLQVKNGKLCGADGNPVQLRGVSTHGLAWYPEYVNADAIAYMHESWGINVLRLALYTTSYGGFCVSDEGTQADLLKLIDTGVAAATENDMYVIIDWHILEDGNPNTYVGRAEEFWKSMSQKYADNEHVIYEICNEPNGGTTWDQVKNYADRIIPIIRANDKKAPIIVGTPTWSQDVDIAAKDPITCDDNVMYALHFYAATHKANLREKAQKAIDAGLCIFVSEFSICDASGNGNNDVTEANKWMDFLNDNAISCVEWNLSNKAESSALFSPSCKKTSGWDDNDMSESGKWMIEHIGGIVEK